ncbi:MAG: hypothetical protein HY913_21810 [Desulfomonile tiedjei]|nr:hypothetical protein [Desulfomonile tiedjei]
MEIEEAFDKITSILTAASARGITPSVRVTREEWVCTIEDKQVKTNIIAKEGELIIVNMDLQKGRPEVDRCKAPDLAREKIVERIEKALTKVRAD